jgi:V8-like Glu-specific endopeptidase
MIRAHLLAFLLLFGSLRAAPTAQTVQVFTALCAQNQGVVSTLGISHQGVQVSRVYTQGSAWAVELDGRTYLVTAAHVVGVGTHLPPVAFQEVKNGDIVTRTKIVWGSAPVTETAFAAQVGIGDFGTPIKSVGVFGSATKPEDMVLLEPTTDRVWTELHPTKLAANAPRIGDLVQVLGFPETFTQQLTTATVTAVLEQQGYFVLNTKLAPGNSGGLVTDKDGLAIGVVTSTTKDQTTVSLVTGSRLKGGTFKPADQVLSLHPEVFLGLR